MSELRELSQRQRAILGLEDPVLALFEAAVIFSIHFTRSGDTASIETRIDAALEAISNLGLPSGQEEPLEAWLSRLERLGPESIPNWVKRLKDGQWRNFLKRLIGAARYDRLALALTTDCSIIAEGLREAMQHLEPFAVAFDDLVAVLPPKQIDKIWNLPGGLTKSALRVVIQLDRAMGNLIDSRFDWTALEHDFDDTADLSERIAKARPLISDPLRVSLTEINDKLTRKLNGALTALEVSDDGVSQAANSIVELIDRLLRAAFTDDDVMAWLAATDRRGQPFTYRHSHDRDLKPTKKAQALCFVYGGRTVEKSTVHEILAAALVSARDDLQKLKHADGDDPAEEQKIRRCITAVEGFLTLSIRLGLNGLTRESAEALRLRLAG